MNGYSQLPAEARDFRRRARMVDAAVREMADHGYGGVTVASITERAGVSPQAFYDQFPGKEEALVHAYDIAVAFAVPQILAAMHEAADWRGAARAALATYLEILDCDHAWALVCLRETSVAGERVQRVRDALRAPIMQALRGLPDGSRGQTIAVEAVVGALDAVAIDGIRHRPDQPLASRRRELAQFVLAPFSDAPVPDEPGVVDRPCAPASGRIEALIGQGPEGESSLGFLVRAAVARRDGPTLWRVIVGLQQRRADGLAVPAGLMDVALDGLGDAWFFGLPETSTKADG